MTTATAPQNRTANQVSRPNGPPARSTALTNVSDDSLLAMEAIAADCGMLSLSGEQNRFSRALKLANGIKQLKDAIEPLMPMIMELQGTSLGFRTDKDKDGGYTREVVKECAIECILRGGQLVGNEMNIIASRFYATKEFFVRALREYPGMAKLELFPGVPALGQNGALVPYIATWVLNGTPDRLEKVCKLGPDNKTIIEDTRICVRVNQGMGADAILGKAERKMRAAIYSRITGSNVLDEEVGDDPKTLVIPAGATKSQEMAARLGVSPEADPFSSNDSNSNGIDQSGESSNESADETPLPTGNQLSQRGQELSTKITQLAGQYAPLCNLMGDAQAAYGKREGNADPEAGWIFAQLDEAITKAKAKSKK